MSTLSQFAHAQWLDGASKAHALFSVDGLRCAGCSGSLERRLTGLEGVARAAVNLASSRVSVEWDPERTSLRQILQTVTTAGFTPVPLAGVTTAQAQQAENRIALKRLGLAGLGMMQTMMFVYGLNASSARGIDPAIAQYLRIAGMLFATPVLFYSGRPILEGAIRSLRRRSLGMDVPVGLALALAFGASVFNTLRGSGEIYFDSVTMFIFFLLAGRFIEMRVRHGGLSASEALARSVPATVGRVGPGGEVQRVAVDRIVRADVLSIPRGAVVPVDARLQSAAALIDESLVSGESAAVRKSRGDELPGGSVNTGDPIRVEAMAGIEDSTLTTLARLLERAQGQKPAIARLADRVASRFVLATLLLAAAVAVAWLLIEPARAFPATLAVLVVTCPCALSLATPAAIAAATAKLARHGLLVTRSDALERMAHVDLAVLDKTGTLTRGSPVAQVARTSVDLSPERALAVAAALESSSDHPLASAFSSPDRNSIAVAQVEEVPGQGMHGLIDGVPWRLGRAEFVAGVLGTPPCTSDSRVYLGSAAGQFAQFDVQDAIRDEAPAAVRELNDLGIECVIASGDRPGEVERAAGMLQVRRRLAHASPADKLAFVEQEQAGGRRVLMLGDGINDGPVLAAADVSCAMGQGAAIAHSAADLLLLNDSPRTLVLGIRTAHRMLQVMRQNLIWAFGYNLATVPLAALGKIPPWMAALGMSISSLFVVVNAARLARTGSSGPNNGVSPP